MTGICMNAAIIFLGVVGFWVVADWLYRHYGPNDTGCCG